MQCCVMCWLVHSVLRLKLELILCFILEKMKLQSDGQLIIFLYQVT